jgi:plastocyanin
MENHAANGMMTLIQYDGAIPTGPVAEFFNPDGGMPSEGDRHAHGGSAAPAETTPSMQAAAPAIDASQSQAPAANVIEVAMLDDRFDPPELTVAAGTTLRFVNKGANWHSVAAFDGSFDSGRVDPGGAIEIRLDIPGTIQFICQHHALRGMTGRVIVTE